MRYLLVLLTAASLYAVDIHEPGRLETFAPTPDVSADYIGFSNGYAIDTRAGEPALPAELRIDEYAGGAGYYLLQVKGPVYTEWLDALKSLGIDVIVYIPNYSFIVYAQEEQLSQARTLDFVKWIGIYQPAYKLEKPLISGRGQARIVMQLFPRADVKNIVQAVERLGYSVVLTTDNELCKTVEAVVDLNRIPELARITDVSWIQLWSEPTFVNSNSQWVCMTGYKASGPGADSVYRRSWTKGVRGQGTILSLTDSGVTTAHLQFYDAAYPITAPGVFPNHRKMVAYKNYVGAVFGDNSAFSWHGTHTDGTTAGNDTLLGPSVYDGIAKEAKLYFVDVGSNGGLVVTTDLTTMYDTVYLGRGLPYQIYQHSGSWGWGNSSGTYLTQDATTDAYGYKYPRLLNIYAAGNEYSTRTLRNPGISKNSITVGATGNGTASNTIASFSSRGPTADNRIKPNLCAPGDVLYSAAGGGTNGYASLSGTSMATPSVNGTIGLMRQYLMAGYYPSGAANPADSIRYISANLLRAMAIVSCDPNIGAYVPPEFNAGWGRIDAESVLFYTGDARKLMLKDDTSGVTTGISKIDSFNVNSGIPLRICVVWTDTAAAASAARTLINNINVQLTSPGGTNYRGNLYTSGQSTSNPTTWDTLNVEECFRINAPTTGRWRLTVSGQTIPNGPMGFAYAITGDVSPVITAIEESHNLPTPIGKVTFNSITSGRINLKITLVNKGLVEARLYDLNGRIAETIARTELPAGLSVVEHESNLPSGVYFLEVRTATDRQIGKILIVK
jgi:subtilisin family serine protease